ncbi:AI-2E family transporter [Dyadobacter crusticola]|uniref:AI-2E family transporter n=1 Tax=Dyadobacter crusticola TaxID=292407 RepID=UPI0004E18505|nr:AI-2E family transporter [Dyadobacter crusticola]
MVPDFNFRLRQVFYLIIVIALAITIFKELYIFFPGFLGALTLYILCRKYYFYLTVRKNWNKSLTALLFMTLFFACIVAPIYFSLQMVYTKVEAIIKDPTQVNQAFDAVSKQLKEWTGQDLLTKNAISNVREKVGGIIPGVLNSSATMLGNLLMILFLAFFMFTNGHTMEKNVRKFIPLNRKNIDLLADETISMVRANAIGIPLVSIIQGVVAVLGYWIFGVEDFVLLGLVTGICAFFPVIGTALIWLPVVIFMFSTGDNGKAIGLAIYCGVVVGNIDYLARVSFLKKIGDVHPVTTILGLIVGLRLFGFWGFIFGPLMISILLLLIKIYKTEFGETSEMQKADAAKN